MKIIVPSLLCFIRFGAYANNQNFLLHKKKRAGRKRTRREKNIQNTFDWCFRVCIIEKLFLLSVHKVILGSEINEFINTPFRLWAFKIGEMDLTQGHNSLQSSQSASIQSGEE